MSEITSINSVEEYDKKVTNSTGIILLDIWAEWCGPCKQVFPIIEELNSEINKETEGKLTVFKIDADANKDIVTKLGIRSIPTLIFFKDGAEMKRLIGLKTKKDMLSVIESL